ncbi:glycosyl hydrolase family 28 protein [Pectobacterium aroidearum]|uniref:glycosyl hydrolase family 28 protein n=1 Tax=Pectobacterium aroidearum TaxID=1201031 RepID=UPI002115BDFD|nr:glycoside hydrolase family 28 protein [Pectobacterium aroidearum]UUE46313.1 glycoside hydrolase family 28 protein [Pectobacterium aroidearum]UUE50534.1 glycoside hydrolase family 28 protein [Pectobacterium aroidearum]UUE54739.1 glycoside hydrolase family 28 protein [Pectobacterium aroidearum]UUE63147.1 glycoside hydrolase family 28 protein [Pectobacterium aroidearum]UUE67372.1 glycoside hydrolase family 28 protein [Pectobacterium aroidearum]
MTDFLPRTRLTLCATLVLSGLIAGCSDSDSTPNVDVDRSAAPQNLKVPTLAYDDNSVVLAWEKPTKPAAGIKDYRVYMNGTLLGGTIDNQNTHSPAKPYIDNFYNAIDTDNWHVRVSFHNFKVTNLSPETEYRFTVRALYDDGKESVDSETIVQKTTATPASLNVTNYGAKGDGIANDTLAIQKAIDDCTPTAYPKGCKVVVEGGTFKTGALFLHSDMTFEVAKGATLLGSANGDDYPLARGYYLYPYTSPQLPKRPPSLINVLEADDRGNSHAGTFKNIRIVGQGTIDGNGWTRGIKASDTNITEIDELKNELPLYRASKATNVGSDGILAKDQTAKAVTEGMSLEEAYKNRRSSLMTLRGVSNMYLEGLTILNPAYHGVMVLESENVAMNALVHTTYDANNADGIEFGNSQNVMVFNNFFDTGDDSVNFAAGYGAEVATLGQKAQSGAWIFNNYFRRGHGAVVTGSHTGAWIEKIVAEDNVMNKTDVGLRMKSRPYYGGGSRDVVFRNNAMRDIVNEPFVFTIKYKADVNDTQPAAEPAQFRDVTVSNVTIDGSAKKNSILVDGMTIGEMADAYKFSFERDAYHQGLHFENVKFRSVKATDITFLKNSDFKNVIFENVPGAWNFGHIENIRLEDRVNNDAALTTSGDETITREAATE